MARFIRLIQAEKDDLENSDWLPIYFNVDNISTMNINDAGFTNIDMVGGGKWTVQEKPKQIIERLDCKNL